jgi:threonine/homoserine/homoserine lactone efflux protein
MNFLLALASLTGVWFLVVIIPGPNFVVVSQSAMSNSRNSGLRIALGVSTGASVWATASLLGLSLVFEHAGWLYDSIRVIGGMYLLYMGVKTIWAVFSSSSTPLNVKKCSGTEISVFQRGLFTSFSNPKTAAFFGSLFVAAFPAHAPVWVYVGTIGMVFCVSFLWYSVVACFFSIAMVQDIYHKLKRGFDIITGSLLSLLGIRVAFSKS